MKPKFLLVSFSIIATLLILLSSCTRIELPKILALGFVDGGFELSVLDLNNNTREYITNNKVITPTSFSYCESNKEIAYSAFVESGEEIILWKINYDTYALTRGNNKYRFPVWSPDCLFLAFNSYSQNGPRVQILNIQDKTIRPLISDQNILSEGISWSPNSHLIATHLPVFDSLGNKTAYNLGIVNTENMSLVNKIRSIIDFPFSTPSWHSDGEYFLFSAKQESTFDLYKYDTSQETVSLIVASKKDDRLPVMSPDGNHFVFLESELTQNKSRICLLDALPKSVTYLTNSYQNITGLFWLNNEQVIYSKYDQIVDETSFYLIDINDIRETKLGAWDGQFLNPTLFP